MPRASKNRPKADPDKPFDPDARTPGSFTLEGKWNPRGTPPENHDPTTSLYWFVDMLVTKRRAEPTVPPYVYASRIERSAFRHAFPMALAHQGAGRWTGEVEGEDGARVPVPWCAAQVETDAELAVKNAGFGAQADKLVRLYKAEIHARPDLRVDQAFVAGYLQRPQLALDARYEAAEVEE